MFSPYPIARSRKNERTGRGLDVLVQISGLEHSRKPSVELKGRRTRVQVSPEGIDQALSKGLPVSRRSEGRRQ